jgi:hypothetical protein
MISVWGVRIFRMASGWCWSRCCRFRASAAEGEPEAADALGRSRGGFTTKIH